MTYHKTLRGALREVIPVDPQEREEAIAWGRGLMDRDLIRSFHDGHRGIHIEKDGGEE